MARAFTILFFVFFSFSAFTNTPKVSIEEYIATWKDIAMNQMFTHGVPASITLSQGILESGFGNSELAVEANNHFGIKCHDWKGETFLKDDDKKNECFRKYKNAAQSYEDHSNFLSSRSRYDALFELEITDYKSWAIGLKTAGYATNPEYPKRLIDLIERYDLHQYDQIETNDWIVDNNEIKKPSMKGELPSNSEAKTTNQLIKNNTHKVYTNQNRTKYVIAGEYDTFYLIAKEFGYSLRQLNRWNDFPATKDVLTKGDKVYIMRKRKKIKDEVFHQELKSNQSLWQIAQEHGVQLKYLITLNKLNSPNVAEQR